eukprot:8729558-Pyramimonas_sp.AAC.1
MGSSCQCTNFGLNFFTEKNKEHAEFPALKGKAAEAKDFLPALREAWRKFGRMHRDFELVDGAALAMIK